MKSLRFGAKVGEGRRREAFVDGEKHRPPWNTLYSLDRSWETYYTRLIPRLTFPLSRRQLGLSCEVGKTYYVELKTHQHEANLPKMEGAVVYACGKWGIAEMPKEVIAIYGRVWGWVHVGRGLNLWILGHTRGRKNRRYGSYLTEAKSYDPKKCPTHEIRRPWTSGQPRCRQECRRQV